MRRFGSVVLSIIFLAVALIPNLTFPTPAYAADAPLPLPEPEDPLGKQPEQSIPEITINVDVRDGHLTVRVVDIWGPGRVPFIVRSFTNAENDLAYKPDTSAQLYAWQFNHRLDILGTDVLEPDGNRSVYKYSHDRWNGTAEMFQVYVKAIGTYSRMEMRHTCAPPPPPCGIECLRQSRARTARPRPGFRIQGATAAPPAGCTWDGTHRVYLPKGIVRLYQGGGLITEERDANGSVTTFSYTTFADGVGKYLASVTDPVGRQIIYTNSRAFQKCVRRDPGQENKGECLEYKWVYKVSSIRDPYGRTASYTYDGAGNILTGTNAAGRTTSYRYVAPILAGLTNARGYTTDINWTITAGDSKWRVSTVTAPGGAATQYAYTVTPDSNNNYRVFRTVVTNALSHPTTYDMYTGTDSNYFGNLERVTDAAGNITHYAYDARHNVTQVTDPRGNRTTYQYNDRNKLTQIVQAAGSLNLTTKLTWDANDDLRSDLLSLTNPRDIRTEYTYTSSHNLTSVRRGAGTPDESLTRYTFTSWGGVASVLDPRGNTTTYDYATTRQLLRITPPAGGATSYTYNNVDDQVTVTNGNGRTWVTSYNPSRLVTSIADPLGNTIRHEYDANGNRTRSYDGKSQATTFDYDSRDRLTSITDPMNGITRYEYDLVSNLTRIINARNHPTRFTYDSANRITHITNALGYSSIHTYDPAGNLATMRDRKGTTHTYGYDQANRLIQVSAGGLTVSHAFDANGNRISMTDGGGTTNFTYDNLDRLTRRTTPDSRSVQYAYDGSGNRTRLTYPDGNTNLVYQYDAANRLIRITQGTLSWTLSYDGAGNRTAISHPNGMRTDYAYSSNTWLESIIHRRSDGSIFQSFTYTHDDNGNRKTQADSSGTTTFTYDPLNRLTAAAYPGTYGNWSWTYDSVGNRTSQTAPNGTTTYSYDPVNRLTQAGAVTYSYDDNGNLTSTSAGQSFAWDAFNRLTQASGSGGSVTYTYNGDGQKIRRTGPDGATVYYYDGIRPIWEADGAGTLKAQLDRDIFGNLLSRREGSARRYFAFDGLGGSTGIADESATFLASFLYDAWGNIRASHGTWTGGLYLFTGAELDLATGLYHMGVRFYEPTLGRWLSEDPAQNKHFEPQSLNFYSYAANNPTILVDPNGESPIIAALILGSLVGLMNYGIAMNATGGRMTLGGIVANMGAGAALALTLVGGGAAAATATRAATVTGAQIAAATPAAANAVQAIRQDPRQVSHIFGNAAHGFSQLGIGAEQGLRMIQEIMARGIAAVNAVGGGGVAAGQPEVMKFALSLSPEFRMIVVALWNGSDWLAKTSYIQRFVNGAWTYF